MAALLNDTTTDYDTDFVRWADRQAALLRCGDVSLLDLENLAEEIESLSRSDRRALRSRLVQIYAHLLKWLMLPDRRSRSWRNTIEEQREQVGLLFEDSPSLRTWIDVERLEQIRRLAATEAARQTEDRDADYFLQAPEWTVEQIIDADAWPDEQPSSILR